ncbi:MAG: iron-containing alcohol dehydrogenase, partial [Pseudomonadota bacterium]
MYDFQFQTTKSILSEIGATARIGELAAGLGVTRAAFVTDKGILDAGIAAVAMNSLMNAGIAVILIDHVVADPPERMILDAVDFAKRKRVDGVVSVGGGSSLDTAKLVALLMNSDQPIEQMYGVGLAEGERLPLILAPTTAGTGSEVTPISIVTTGTA